MWRGEVVVKPDERVRMLKRRELFLQSDEKIAVRFVVGLTLVKKLRRHWLLTIRPFILLTHDRSHYSHGSMLALSSQNGESELYCSWTHS